MRVLMSVLLGLATGCFSLGIQREALDGAQQRLDFGAEDTQCELV